MTNPDTSFRAQTPDALDSIRDEVRRAASAHAPQGCSGGFRRSRSALRRSYDRREHKPVRGVPSEDVPAGRRVTDPHAQPHGETVPRSVGRKFPLNLRPRRLHGRAGFFSFQPRNPLQAARIHVKHSEQCR